MSKERYTSFQALKAYIEDGHIELTEQPKAPELTSFINADVNTSLFITRFTKEDVDDFCDLLARYPAIKYRDSLETILSREFNSWMRLHQGRCPYEPFLWALKITDNYFGSIANSVSEPDKSMLDPICNALEKIYKSEYDEIIENVLLNWEWYQPVHVMIKLYENLNFENDIINQRLRGYWLLHFLYTHNAYKCLLRKDMDEANAKAVLYHICNDKQSGVNGSDIDVTKKDRQAFLSMYREQKPEVKNLIQTLYSDRRQSCPKPIRALLDEALRGKIANATTHDSRIIKEMQAYSLASSDDERDRAQMDFVYSLYDLMGQKNNPDLDTVVTEAPHYQLADCVANTILGNGFGFSTQFMMLKLLNSNQHEYQTVIEQKFTSTCSSGIRSDEGMLYACATCILGHSELVEKVVRSYFVDGFGLKAVQYVFNRIKIVYKSQFDEAVDIVLEEGKQDINKAYKIISNCVKVAGKNPTIPVVFDALCDQLVNQALDDAASGLTYARAVLDLINNVGTVANRQRYYTMLESLRESTKPHLQSIKKKANDLIRKLWPVA